MLRSSTLNEPLKVGLGSESDLVGTLEGQTLCFLGYINNEETKITKK